MNPAATVAARKMPIHSQRLSRTCADARARMKLHLLSICPAQHPTQPGRLITRNIYRRGLKPQTDADRQHRKAERSALAVQELARRLAVDSAVHIQVRIAS